MVYDNCPVDLLLGRNCDNFSDILMTAEDPTQSFQVTTRHQQAESRQEDDTLTEQLEKGIEPNPLADMLGENFDFPQTNLSLQDTDQIHEVADDFDRQFLAKDQKTDPSLAELWQTADTEGSQFTVVSDILHRKTTDQNGRPYLQIVLPADRRAEIIKIAHSTPMAGHLGGKATKYKVMRNFFGTGMSADIKEACQSCEHCQKTAKKVNTTAPMQITQTFTEPFHRVALDIVGPLPLTPRKHLFILISHQDIQTQNPSRQPHRKQWLKHC